MANGYQRPRILCIAVLALSLFVVTVYGSSAAPRTRLLQSYAPTIKQQERIIDFALESFDFATNVVRARLMSFGEAPSQIAVIVKPVSSPDEAIADPFAAFRSSPRDDSSNSRSRFGREIEDMRAMSKAWENAAWTSFSTNLAIDLGPGSGWRVIWIAGKWNGKMERAAGTWVHVEHSPNLIVVTEKAGSDGPDKLRGTGKVMVASALRTNREVLNGSQPACGSFRLRLTETAGHNLVLLASTNLIDWTPIVTNWNSKEIFEYTDTNVSQYGCRFFRVVVVP